MRYKKNIIDYFQETVVHNANKIAVLDGEKTISFFDLDNKSKCLAIDIINRLQIINKPIATFLPKGIDVIIANIGSTYSGNIYMNVDINSPVQRLQNIFEIIQPQLIITNSKYVHSLPNMGIQVLNIDEIDYSQKFNESVIEEILDKMIDTDPLCIINTSGSTGTPKGVVLNHRSFIDFLENSLEVFKFSESEIIGSLSPIVFDIYSFELTMLMANASTILIIPNELTSYPVEILRLLDRHKVTFLFWVPTIMVNIVNMDLLSKIKLDSIKNIWFAGEVFPTNKFNYWKRNLQNCKFANLYGPIEITLDCTYFVVNRELNDDESIPIGNAYKNTDILILDETNQKVTSSNIDGELCVRGSSLAMGYYNNLEKTREVFVQNPLNDKYPEIIYRTGDIVSFNEYGEIIFKGRKDTLIKHLGYRIELSEIEHTTIDTLKLVRNCCVVYDNDSKRIIMFYESENEIDTAIFRKEIGKILPKYMIPTTYYRLNIMPRNVNGKIDRLYLKNSMQNVNNE